MAGFIATWNNNNNNVKIYINKRFIIIINSNDNNIWKIEII